MTALKDLTIELKFIIGFAGSAFIISFLIGMVSGVAFGDIMVRILIIVPFFAGLGFIAITVIKRFVPEVYEYITNQKNSADKEVEVDFSEPKEDNSQMDSETDLSDMSEGVNEESKEDTQEFKELSGDNFENIGSADTADSAQSSASQGKMGKHVIVDEKIGKYEPQVMAKAIRTMMNKDED